jgi:hypothetical protein
MPSENQQASDSELDGKAWKMVHWDDYKLFNTKCMTVDGAKEWIAAGNRARAKGYEVPNKRFQYFAEEAERNR